MTSNSSQGKGSPKGKQQTINHISKILGESNEPVIMTINRIVKRIGADCALQILSETQRIQANGGLLVKDGSRRRTSGGVFFFLVKKFLNSEQRTKDINAIFGAPSQQNQTPMARHLQREKVPVSQQTPAQRTQVARVSGVSKVSKSHKNYGKQSKSNQEDTEAIKTPVSSKNKLKKPKSTGSRKSRQKLESTYPTKEERGKFQRFQELLDQSFENELRHGINRSSASVQGVPTLPKDNSDISTHISHKRTGVSYDDESFWVLSEDSVIETTLSAKEGWDKLNFDDKPKWKGPSPNPNSNLVQIGSLVTLKFHDTAEQGVYYIYESHSSKPRENNIISNESPLGSAILGSRAGNHRTYVVNGSKITVTILNVVNKFQ